MVRSERLERTKEIVNQLGFATIRELADSTGASEATVRRDITQLDIDGAVKKVSGGVKSLLWNGVPIEPSLLVKSSMNVEEKQRIAHAALKYIHEHEHIILDAGSTTLALARMLGKFNDLTAITYDMLIASELSYFESIKLILAGGVLRRNHNSFYGYFTENVFREIHAECAFIGCDALSVEHGIMSYTTDDVEVKRQIIRSASKVILLCDHSKLELETFMSIAPISSIHRIITGSEISDKAFDALKNCDIPLEIV